MENKPTLATFSLIGFKFTEASINFNNIKSQNSSITVDFDPSGIFYSEKKAYELKIEFLAFDQEIGSLEKTFIKTILIADFKFNEVSRKEEIPNYFYKNSIAIIYPYIRAFVSTISLQSNFGPFILPTFNLSMLEDKLIKNTSER